MQKKTRKKTLKLHRETVRRLNDETLERIAGGCGDPTAGILCTIIGCGGIDP